MSLKDNILSAIREHASPAWPDESAFTEADEQTLVAALVAAVSANSETLDGLEGTFGKQDRNMLLYAESCCVDQGGLLEGARMNAADAASLKLFEKHGLARSGRVPGRLLLGNQTAGKTHWVELTDLGWDLAARFRRFRARPEARGPIARKVFEALAEKDS